VKIQVLTGRPYDVTVERGIIGSVGEYAKALTNAHKTAVITDDNVDKLYSEAVEKSLEGSGFHVCKFIFKNGEGSKNLKTFENILEFLAENKLTRSDIIVALGGGVCGDLAGFAAASYLRGIKFIQLPTTFLAAVDSSVGGKTGVNLGSGKNLAGAFWQPAAVLCDIETFKTLDTKTYLDGVAEVIKYGVIQDEEILHQIVCGEYDVEEITAKCIKIKADIVARDEREKGDRRLLNFGHTVGHAVEKLSGYTVSHGHAVAIGMSVIARAYGFGEAVTGVIRSAGLPTVCEYSAEKLHDAMLSDKKRDGDVLNLVVPRRMGKCIVLPVPVGELIDVLKRGLKEEQYGR
jgi:3-dehydroquinate synthase